MLHMVACHVPLSGPLYRQTARVEQEQIACFRLWRGSKGSVQSSLEPSSRLRLHAVPAQRKIVAGYVLHSRSDQTGLERPECPQLRCTFMTDACAEQAKQPRHIKSEIHT